MRHTHTKHMVLIALFASLIAVTGYISIPLPISPVPISGQTLAILLAGLLLSPRDAFMAVVLWILMGIAGMPVFSGGRAGLAVLTGPSGGYIIGFIFAAVATSRLKGKKPNLMRYGLACLLSSLVLVYAFGVSGLMFIAGMPLVAAFQAGVLPFLIGDGLKIIAASLIAYKIHQSAPQLIKTT